MWNFCLNTLQHAHLFLEKYWKLFPWFIMILSEILPVVITVGCGYHGEHHGHLQQPPHAGHHVFLPCNSPLNWHCNNDSVVYYNINEAQKLAEIWPISHMSCKLAGRCTTFLRSSRQWRRKSETINIVGLHSVRFYQHFQGDLEIFNTLHGMTVYLI